MWWTVLFDIFGFITRVTVHISRTRSWVVGSEVKTVDSWCGSLDFILPGARASLPVIVTFVFLLRRLRGELTEHISEHIRERHQLLLPLLLGDDLPTVLHNKLESFVIISPQWAWLSDNLNDERFEDVGGVQVGQYQQIQAVCDVDRLTQHFLALPLQMFQGVLKYLELKPGLPSNPTTYTWSEAARSLSLFSSMFSIFPP